MALNPEEKRSFPRLKLKTLLRYHARGIAEFSNAVSEDLGIGGIGFTGERFIAPKTPLMLEINLLSRIFNTVGEVAWAAPIQHSDRYRLGVKFVEFDLKDKNYLTDYLNLQTTTP